MSGQHQPRLPEQRHSIGMPESEIKLAQISWRHKHGMELDPSLLGNALTFKSFSAQAASCTATGSRVRQEKVLSHNKMFQTLEKRFFLAPPSVHTDTLTL